MSNIIDRILTEVCLDERIESGIFDMENSTHMHVLFETMMDKFGISLENARNIHNKMVEGKYPERQAYNKDGLLVTFPTPQHKARAIQRGTHFEHDPTKGAAGGSNVFGGGQPAAPQGGQPPVEKGATAPQPPTQNVFPTQPTSAQQPEQQPSPQGEPSQLPASDAPPPTPISAPTAGSSLPPSDSPAQQTAASDNQSLAVEPPRDSNIPAPPPNFDIPKPPEQKAAEAQVVKQMLAGDPNNSTLSPTIPVNVSEQLKLLSRMAETLGYRVIFESMNKK